MWGNATLLKPLIGTSKLFVPGLFFLAAFGGLLLWGPRGASRFEVTGTLRVPDDMPRRWRTRYLRKATCSTPCLIASRMRLIRRRCYEQRNLIPACKCTVYAAGVLHWFQPPGSGSTQYKPGTCSQQPSGPGKSLR